MSHNTPNIDGGFEQASAALAIMPPWTLEQLDRKAQKRPPGYSEAVLSKARQLADGRYVLTKADYDAITAQFAIKRPTLDSIIKLFGGKPTPDYGPGTELKQMIENAFGLGAIAGCGCQAMVDRMNRWGVEGCRKRDNFETTIDHLMEKKDKLSKHARELSQVDQKDPSFVQHLNRIAAKTAAAVTPESLQRAALGLIVDQAIDRAEAQQKTISPPKS